MGEFSPVSAGRRAPCRAHASAAGRLRPIAERAESGSRFPEDHGACI